jgi:hemolysin III
MKRLVIYRTEHDHDFSFGYFTVFTLIQCAIWLVLVYFVTRWINPGLAETQISSSWYAYLGTFAAAHTLTGLFEFFFHRYVLHRVFWNLLSAFRRKHTHHHSLTHVRELKNTADTAGRVEVRNKYAIISPEQIQSSTFPGYALVAFWGLASIFLIPAQILLPSLPVLFAGYLGVAFSFALYEIKHAVEHLDYDKHWRRGVQKSRFVRRWYGFHLMHHSRIGVNQAIGGVFALPVWDWVFGTYFVPEELPLPGVQVTPESQEPPKPRRLIQWMDAWVDKCEKRIIDRRKAAVLRSS